VTRIIGVRDRSRINAPIYIHIIQYNIYIQCVPRRPDKRNDFCSIHQFITRRRLWCVCYCFPARVRRYDSQVLLRTPHGGESHVFYIISVLRFRDGIRRLEIYSRAAVSARCSAADDGRGSRLYRIMGTRGNPRWFPRSSRALDNEFIARGNAQRISLSALIFFRFLSVSFCPAAAAASPAVTILRARARNFIEIKF